jgi:hypothetical protein
VGDDLIVCLPRGLRWVALPLVSFRISFCINYNTTDCGRGRLLPHPLPHLFGSRYEILRPLLTSWLTTESDDAMGPRTAACKPWDSTTSLSEKRSPSRCWATGRRRLGRWNRFLMPSDLLFKVNALLRLWCFGCLLTSTRSRLHSPQLLGEVRFSSPTLHCRKCGNSLVLSAQGRCSTVMWSQLKFVMIYLHILCGVSRDKDGMNR